MALGEHDVADRAGEEAGPPYGGAQIGGLSPDGDLVTGYVVALIGFLMPWFRASDDHSWSFDGASYLGISTGPGWIGLIPLLLVVGAIVSLWARGSRSAARLAARLGMMASVLTVFVVTFSFPSASDGVSINSVLARPAGPGLFVLAVGIAFLITGTVSSLCSSTER